MFTIIIVPIFLALSFVINAVLGILVLRANPRATTNRLFITFAFAIALWNLSLFLTIVGAPAQLIWSRLAFSFGVIMFWALFCFAVLFPGERRLSRKFILFTTIPSLLVFIGTLTPYMVRSVAVVNGYITGDLGPVLMIFTIFILLMMIMIFGTLLRKLFTSRGITRVQLIYINLGVGFFVTTFLTTNLILPVFFKIFNFNNLGPVFSFPMNIAIAYAVIRYHLMDIGVLIRRGTVFTLLFGIIALIFISGVSFLNRFFPSPFAEILAALIVTLLFTPLERLLESATDKIFFRKHYRFESAVRELNQLLLKNYKMEGLLEDLLNYLASTFKIGTGAILLEEPSGKYASRYSIGLDRKNLVLENTDPVIQYLKSELQDHGAHKKEILDRSELEAELQKSTFPPSQKQKMGIIIQRLEDLGFTLIIPVFSSKGELIAVMLLGAKKSQYPFSAQDEELLDVVLHETAFSIENSLNIERILELDEAKSEFVRVVSHQLRTPLSVARWNVESALSGNVGAIRNKKLKEAIENAYEGLTRMNDGLNNIITTLEITEGGVAIHGGDSRTHRERILPEIEKQAHDARDSNRGALSHFGGRSQ